MNNLISILLPNLNNRTFLEERIESIYKQSVQDWELIIVDSYSEDGAWEFFKGLASRDDRVKIKQSPRQGIYPAWNECIRRAKGRYVYFATSDDTMSGDCLEKMSTELDKHLECGMANCGLKIFDENSREIFKDWWWKGKGLFAQSSAEYVYRRHIRKAPFDGLLHLFGETVYTSITQSMIRKSLFEKVGFFPTNRGSIADFQWMMKATLITDTIHCPDTWGGWRQHSKQATALANIGSPEHLRTLEAMSQCVLKEAKDFLVEPARNFIRSPAAMLNLRKNRIRAELGSRTDFIHRLDYIVSEARKNPRTIAELMIGKIRAKFNLKRRSFPADWIIFLKNYGIEPNLIPVDNEAPAGNKTQSTSR